MNIKTDSSSRVARLRQRIATLSRPSGAGAAGLFAFGAPALDDRLGGGLARGSVHEVLAEHAEDQASANGFALMMAARIVEDRPIIWVRTDGQERMQGGVYAPGLIELGLDPDALVMVQAPDELAGLRAAADIIGSMGVGAAILELGAAKKLDLTASRRLALAAEKSGVTNFILRNSTSSFASAASTRWQVAAAPSTAFAGEAPGQPALRIALMRHRGGIAPFEITMEWDRDARIFREPALSGALLSIPARRALDDGEYPGGYRGERRAA